MAIPAAVLDLFKRPDTTKILVTAGKDGQPHAIVCGSIFVIDENTLGVGQVLMKTAAAYMSENSKVALEVIDGKSAYEVRGTVGGRIDSGPVLDGLNANLEKIGLRASAVWTFDIKETYDESAGPNAGNKMA